VLSINYEVQSTVGAVPFANVWKAGSKYNVPEDSLIQRLMDLRNSFNASCYRTTLCAKRNRPRCVVFFKKILEYYSGQFNRVSDYLVFTNGITNSPDLFIGN
jgi:hypothetical protein